uniref:Uncharacterized protein n=1 Tax=Romanomermis culicivorax TaxID=13658 RepID=A0A915HIN9_ROMCU
MAAAGGSVGADVGAVVGNFAMLRSKIGVSKSSSSDGSGAASKIGWSSNSLAVNMRAEAIHFWGGQEFQMGGVHQCFDVRKTIGLDA